MGVSSPISVDKVTEVSQNSGKDKICPKFLKALDVVGLFNWISLYNTAILGQTLLVTGVIFKKGD